MPNCQAGKIIECDFQSIWTSLPEYPEFLRISLSLNLIMTFRLSTMPLLSLILWTRNRTRTPLLSCNFFEITWLCGPRIKPMMVTMAQKRTRPMSKLYFTRLGCVHCSMLLIAKWGVPDRAGPLLHPKHAWESREIGGFNESVIKYVPFFEVRCSFLLVFHLY